MDTTATAFYGGSAPSQLPVRSIAVAGRRAMVAVCPLAVLQQEEALALLGEEERRLLDRFKLEKRWREWLGGRLAAKRAVAAVLGDAGRQGYQIVVGDHGQPVVAGRGDLGLSISHSGDYAVAMAVRGHRCGIDIQVLGSSLVSVRSRYCNGGEGRLLARVAPGLLLVERLGILWAAKEACRKAAGGWPLVPLVAIVAIGAVAGPTHFGLWMSCAGRVLPVRVWTATGMAWAMTIDIRSNLRENR